MIPFHLVQNHLHVYNSVVYNDDDSGSSSDSRCGRRCGSGGGDKGGRGGE